MLGEMVLCQRLAELGQFDESLVIAHAATQLDEVVGQPYTMANLVRAEGFAYLVRGDLAAARPVLERCLALCRTWDIHNFGACVGDVGPPQRAGRSGG